MIPTATIEGVGRMRDAWASKGLSQELQAYVRSEYRGDASAVLAEIARAGRVKPAERVVQARQEEPFASIPKAALRRLKASMATIATGLGTTTLGLGWDYYVHEVVKQVTEVESMFAAPHLLIFAGFAITGLGFLAANVASKFLLVPGLARFARARAIR